MSNSYVWKERPKGFPRDDKLPHASDVNQFNDIDDLHSDDNERVDAMENSPQSNSRFMRTRDSVYVSKTRNRKTSDGQLVDDNSEKPNETAKTGVRFSLIDPTNYYADNPTFVNDEDEDNFEDVVLRDKSNTTYFSNTEEFDNYLAFHDINEHSNNST